MKQKLTPERLDELAYAYLHRFGVPGLVYNKRAFQILVHAIIDVQVILSPLNLNWFNRKKQDPELVGATPTPGNEFTVATVAELAQFLSALHRAVSEEYQNRLSQYIPDEIPNTGAGENLCEARDAPASSGEVWPPADCR